MSDRELADIICRALLAIVAGIRRKYGLPAYQNIVIVVQEGRDDLALPINYEVKA